MDGQIAGKEYNRDLIFPLKEVLVPFQSKLIGAFPKEDIKRYGEVTSCKSENYLRIPEYTKDNVVLTSLQA